MKYDDASWHSGGDFPQGLDESAAATHIGMFVAWAASRELLGVLHTESSDVIARLRTRTITPGAWFIANCDGKLTDEDLNEEGDRFTQSYFACDDPLNTRKASYLLDYYAAFPNVDSLYEVPDNWDTFDC